jgi:Ca2+-binding EF-hand superfamily protein
VLASLLQPAAQADRQEKPGKAKGAGGPPSEPAAAPPPGPPPADAAKQFAGDTLGSLLAAQESSRSDSLAAKLIKTFDGDDDGALSVDEIQTTLGTRAPENLAAAVSSLDTDTDGKLSADELSAGLEAHRPGRGPPPRPTSADVASRLIGDVDSDSDGALSLAEITSKLGLGDDSDLTSAFGKLDTDGDGQLTTAELTAALDAFRAKHDKGEQTTQAPVTA